LATNLSIVCCRPHHSRVLTLGCCCNSQKALSIANRHAVMSDPATSSPASADRSAFHQALEAEATQLLSSSPHRDPAALCANIAALIYRAYDETFGERARGVGTAVNWTGFYWLRSIEPDEANVDHADDVQAGEALPPPTQALVLGPFHGAPAVSLIRLTRGVCGAAATSAQVQLVPDVHARPEHIACDSKSRSELVIPLYAGSEEEERLVQAAGAVTVAEAQAATAAASSASSSSSAARPREQLVGVLDMDSPKLAFFTEQDAACLGRIADALGRAADWSAMQTTRIRVRFPADASCSLSKKKKLGH